MHRRRLAIAILLSGLGVVMGCALFGGGGGEVEIKKASHLHTSPPSTWKSVSGGNSDQAFQLPSGAFATMNSSCGRNATAPLEVLTKHLLIGFRNVELQSKQNLSVSGGEGLLTKALATFEGKPFHLTLFVLPLRGCVFDFSLVSPREASETDSKDFLQFVKSFDYGND